jgi:CO/xanthine dehydrogenase Mo-binding subunit
MESPENEDPKGMSEVVLNPIPSAIANAIADATGKRFNSLPITPEVIKAAIL